MKESNSVRRRLLATVPSLPLAGVLSAASIAANGQSPQQSVVSLDIDRTLRVGLDSKEVIDFASTKRDTPNRKPLSSLPPTLDDFRRLDTTIDVARHKTWLVAAIERRYILIRNPQSGPAEPLSTTVPVRTPVILVVVSHLFVRNGVTDDKEQAIAKAFSAYEFVKHGNPQDYAAPLLGPAGVSANMFAILQGWRLEDDRSRPQGFFYEADNALKALYQTNLPGNTYRVPPAQSGGPSSIKPGDVPQLELTGPTKRYGDGSHQLVLVSETAAPMPPPVSEAARPLISKDPQALAKQVKDNLGDELHRIDCTKPFVVKYVPLAQLAAWPEFKVEWRSRWIHIGCVLTEVPEPRLQTRTSRLVVNGYYPNINALPQAVVDAVASCLVSSFAVAAVAGLVLSEFATAVKVFRLLFDACIQYQKEEFRKCLIPGIALLTSTDDWKDV